MNLLALSEHQPERRITRLSFVMSNKIIESVYLLPIIEQRILTAYLAKVTPLDTSMPLIEISTDELSKMCGGIEMRPDRVDSATTSIMSNVVKIKGENGEWVKFTWFTTALYEPGGKLVLRVNPDLEPYLIQLKERFTQILTDVCMQFKSPYSVRLYQLLKIYYKLHEHQFTVNELKQKMEVTAKSYDKYKNFKAGVLLKAIEEINTISDLEISFEEVKFGRRVESLIFTINAKDEKGSKYPGLDEYNKLVSMKKIDIIIMLIDAICRITKYVFNEQELQKYRKETLLELYLTLKRGVYRNRKIAIPRSYFVTALESIENGNSIF
jgi:plasmid replication initiation protein